MDGLPEGIAVLAGSVVSADRLIPDHWSGPFSCWGVENREAAVRLVVAWCELRADFRSFRTDRVFSAEFLEERYPERPAILRARWRKVRDAQMRRMDGAAA